jgi:NitT/TauT family transport system permease protein
VELPFATMGLVWNSMMSMAGGWFFLMICEAFRLGQRDFRLPGLGAYMSAAVEQGDLRAMLWAIAAMTLAIVGLDQLFWRPVVVWAQKFRVEEGGSQEMMSSWLLDWLRRSWLLAAVGRYLRGLAHQRTRPAKATRTPQPNAGQAAVLARGVSLAAFAALCLVILYGGWKLVILLGNVSVGEWVGLVAGAFLTLLRVLSAVVLGTLWTLPVGLAIGLSPRLSRVLQPVVQVVASFPAPMLFPLVIVAMRVAGVSLDWGSIVLMLLGTQWYILFNVIAGAMAIPADLREAADSYRLAGWRRFRTLYLPAVFPYLVTGWVTAAGGAWNASIVAEYVTFRGEVLKATGLGQQIMAASASEPVHYHLLAASILVMATMVVVFNRLVWRRCYRLAEERFSLNK